MSYRRAALALLAAATGAARAENNSTPIEDPCTEGGGFLTPPTVTQLDFTNVSVGVNTLHLPGGNLTYDNVGVVRDRPTSLVITDESGLYHKIVDAWAARNENENRGNETAETFKPLLNSTNNNGVKGEFARINMQTVRGDNSTGRGDFLMRLVDTATGEPAPVERFL